MPIRSDIVPQNKMKAIDLYGGVGGWSLGLKLAGVKVVRHFEWWPEAVVTYNANFGGKAQAVDIREIDVDRLKRELKKKYGKIDIVVGSPPCTQFSYSNRGGGGDIADGLRDIRKFLEIVQAVGPKYWAMENVPRAAKIISAALEPGGALSSFAGLVSNILVVDASDFGVPQNRKRMIAGNFPAGLLARYKNRCEIRTLGNVISMLGQPVVIDPVYGNRTKVAMLTDNDTEEPLNDEEIRLNREAKEYHPVYNKMSFPDRFDRPSRTITATCTRVSRESIVIATKEAENNYRRLTVRERASAQSFPVKFQFLGASYSSRVKMVGNAMPPLLAYYVASAMSEIPADEIRKPKMSSNILSDKARAMHHPVALDRSASRYMKFRNFRAAIPGLRFGSGVRFDLFNQQIKDGVVWKVRFYFGPSKDIRTLELNRAAGSMAMRVLTPVGRKRVKKLLSTLVFEDSAQVSANMQNDWALRRGEVHPHKFIDKIGSIATKISDIIRGTGSADKGWEALRSALFGVPRPAKVGQSKFEDNAAQILAGVIVGAHVNLFLAEDVPERLSTLKKKKST